MYDRIYDKAKFTNKLPLVSVIVCAYNREKFISSALDSILSQELEDYFEIIIGDDYSSDSTRDILRRYQKEHPSKIKLIFHKENCGLGKNWALLVREARGNYIALCDDDDDWHNNQKLKIQIDYLNKNPEYGVVHTDYNTFDGKKTIISFNKSNQINIPTGLVTKEIYNGELKIIASSSLLRKQLIDKYVPLDVYIKHRFTQQDWPTWIILSKYSQIGYIPISTTTYRTGHNALSRLQTVEALENKLKIDYLMYKHLSSMFPDDILFSEENFLDYKNNLLLNLSYKKRDFNNAIKYASCLKKHNVKTYMCKNKLMFYVLSILLHIKNRFS